MSDERERYRTAYRFGGLERRGLAGGLRASQVIVLGAACILAVGIFRRWSSAGGLGLAVAIVAGGCVISWLPVQGRGVDEWLTIVAGWVWLRHHRRQRSLQPQVGTTLDLRRTERLPQRRLLPQGLGDLTIEALRLADGGDIGIFSERRASTMTAVLSVRVRSFALLAASEQERRLLRWGRAVASLARTSSAVRRVQVLERTVPHDEYELRRWLDTSADDAFATGHPVRRSYETLVDDAADVTQDHEVLLALQIDGRRVRRGDARAVLLREIRGLSDQLDGADAGIVGALGTADCLRLVRRGFSPFERPVDASRPLEPIGAEPRWDLLRTDGTLHRTYWIAQWPRLEVGPAFLTPMLLTANAVRTFSVVLEPVPPLKARRAVEAAITSDEADEQLRRERGFRTPARRRDQQAATMRREAELAEGHEEVRFTGYVTVSGRDEAELERHCDEVASGCSAGVPRPAADVGTAGQRIPVRGAAALSRACRAESLRAMRRPPAKRPGHRATTATFQSIYPFVAEGGPRRPWRVHRPRPLRRLVRLRPVLALRAADPDQPQHARHRRGRLGQVVAGQVLPAPPGAIWSTSVDQRPEGRVRRAGSCARCRPDPSGTRRGGPRQPDRSPRGLVRTTRAPPGHRRELVEQVPRAGGAWGAARGHPRAQPRAAGADAPRRSSSSCCARRPAWPTVSRRRRRALPMRVARRRARPAAALRGRAPRHVRRPHHARPRLSWPRASSSTSPLSTTRRRSRRHDLRRGLAAGDDAAAHDASRTRWAAEPKFINVFDEAWRALSVTGVGEWLQDAFKKSRSYGLQNVVVMHRLSDLAAAGAAGSREARSPKGCSTTPRPASSTARSRTRCPARGKSSASPARGRAAARSRSRRGAVEGRHPQLPRAASLQRDRGPAGRYRCADARSIRS